MPGGTAPHRGALGWRRVVVGLSCILALAAVVASAASLPGSGTRATAVQATPEAMASPAASPAMDWSNGADLVWSYQTGTDYWAGRFPPIAGGVFGVFTAGSNILQVFDAERFIELWTFDGDDVRYSWRPREDAFFVSQGDTLSAYHPRSGVPIWTYTVEEEEWDWSTSVSDGQRPFVFITSDERLTVLDFHTGEELYRIARGGEDLDWHIDESTMILENGNVLSVVDLDAGVELWRYRGEGSDLRWSAVDEEWYVVSGSTLSVLDPATGQEHWRFTGSGEALSYATRDDMLHVTSGADVSLIERSTGTERWRFTGNGAIDDVGVLDGTLLVATETAISSVDPEIGVELWRYSLPGFQGWLGARRESSDTIFVRGESSISALDLASGTERWRVASNASIDVALRVPSGLIVYAAGTALVGVDGETGTERWRLNVATEIGSLADDSGYDWQLSDNGHLTFIADDILYAVDAATGGELWRSERLAAPMYSSLDADARTYRVALDDAGAVLIDAETGETLLQGWWDERDGIVYNRIGNRVSAFDLASRQELWQYAAPMEISRFYLGDELVWMSFGNRLAAVDRETGVELWAFDTQATIASVDIDEGIVRLTDEAGTLYALAPKPIRLEAGGTAVTTELVTLHGAPNPTSVERGSLPAGTAVTITGASDEHNGETWWPVTTGEVGEQGWVPADMLEPTGNAASASPTPGA